MQAVIQFVGKACSLGFDYKHIQINTSFSKYYMVLEGILKQVKLGPCPFCFVAMDVIVFNVLESIGNKIAQAQTPIQRHMLGMRQSHALLVFFLFFPFLYWFIQTIWDNSYPSLDQHDSLIFSYASFVIFLLTTCNPMLYPLHPHFTSTQRLLNPLLLLMFDTYSLQMVW